MKGYLLMMLAVVAVVCVPFASGGNLWQVDVQGNNLHQNLYGQTDPVDMTEPGTWNIFEIQAIDVVGGSSSTSGPMSMALVDDEGAAGSVVLTIDNPGHTLTGWSGDGSQESQPLGGDYFLALAPGGDTHFALGTTGSFDWTVSGLLADTEYELALHHAYNFGDRGIDFTVNGVEVSVTGAEGNRIALITVTSDSNGEIIGTGSFTGNEGNWAGLVIDLVDEAKEPSPADGEINVLLDAELTWTAGIDAVESKVYFGTDPNVASLSLLATVDAGNPQTATPTGMQRDMTYYWKVDTVTASGNVEGKVWQFDTVLSVPIITAQPVSALVDQGTSVTLTVEAFNPFTSDETGLSYQWYQGTEAVGSNSNTYTVASAAVGDEGDYYCEIKIVANGATSESDVANLSVKRMLGHWPLDGDANDASGNGWDNINTGSTNTWSEGASGSEGDLAANFDAVDPNSFINVGNVPIIVSGEMTISLWAKPANIARDWSGFISKWGPDGNTMWIGQHSTDGMLNYSTYLPGETRNTPAGVLANDAWSHVVCLFDGQFQETYINGMLVASVEVNAVLPVLDGDLLIGTIPTGNLGNYFEGLIDEVAVYNYVLSPTEIAEVYSDVAGPFCAVKPVYDFNDDCKVDMADFATFAATWLECDIFPTCITTIE